MAHAERPAVIHLVPRLGQRIDGVAGYARALAAALDRHGIGSRFLAGDPDDQLPHESPDGDDAAKVAARSADALVTGLESLVRPHPGRSPVVLLHYVNYGYAVRGCPFWLVRGLARWKVRNPGARLVTMFHELYAFGAPWRSSFWLSPVQRHLARRVWGLTDAAVTNTGRYRRQLLQWRPAAADRLALLPVFSALGEFEQPPEWRARGRELVVLGRADAAVHAYGRCRPTLLRACRAMRIERIVDVGPRICAPPARIGDVEVSALGYRSAEEVGAILRRSCAGFLHYPSDHLGKSTVFAAYAAHGLVPIVSWRRGEEEPGLAEGRNYWTPSVSEPQFDRFESIADQARRWYESHRLPTQAALFAALTLDAAA